MRGDLVPLLLLAPILIAAAVSDLRRLKIPNMLVLAALALFAATAPFLTLHEFGLRMMAGTISFAIGFALFSLRLFGGGDVKLFAALMLFVPAAEWRLFLQLFAFSLLVGSLATLGLQHVPTTRTLDWESRRRKGRMPVGVSMALAAVLLPIVAGT